MAARGGRSSGCGGTAILPAVSRPVSAVSTPPPEAPPPPLRRGQQAAWLVAAYCMRLIAEMFFLPQSSYRGLRLDDPLSTRGPRRPTLQWGCGAWGGLWSTGGSAGVSDCGGHLSVNRQGTGHCWVEHSPPLSLRCRPRTRRAGPCALPLRAQQAVSQAGFVFLALFPTAAL